MATVVVTGPPDCCCGGCCEAGQPFDFDPDPATGISRKYRVFLRATGCGGRTIGVSTEATIGPAPAWIPVSSSIANAYYQSFTCLVPGPPGPDLDHYHFWSVGFNLDSDLCFTIDFYSFGTGEKESGAAGDPYGLTRGLECCTPGVFTTDFGSLPTDATLPGPRPIPRVVSSACDAQGKFLSKTWSIAINRHAGNDGEAVVDFEWLVTLVAV